MNRQKLQELKEAIDSLPASISIEDAAKTICPVRGKMPPEQVASPGQLSAEITAAFVEFMLEEDGGE